MDRLTAGVGEVRVLAEADVIHDLVDVLLVDERPPELRELRFDALDDVLLLERQEREVEVDDRRLYQPTLLQSTFPVVHADLADVLEVVQLRLVPVKSLLPRQVEQNFGDLLAAEVGEEDEHRSAEVLAAHQRVMVQHGGDAVEDSARHFVDLIEHEDRVRAGVDGFEDFVLDLLLVVTDPAGVGVLRAVEDVVVLAPGAFRKHRLGDHVGHEILAGSLRAVKRHHQRLLRLVDLLVVRRDRLEKFLLDDVLAEQPILHAFPQGQNVGRNLVL